VTVPVPAGFRRAGPHDLALLEALEVTCFEQPWHGRELAVWLEPERGAAWLVESGGRAVGFALFQLLPGAAELLRVAVTPDARRRGLARAALAEALRSLAGDGRPTCYLEVRSGNRPALALYEALGFRTLGLRRAYYENGEDALVLGRGAPEAGSGGG
jgi:ribosomal-protein-alanine N-acetyltransferase